MYKNQRELPVSAILKSNNHHSTHTWMVYQSSPTDIRLVNFNSDHTLKETYILDVGAKPIQAIRLAYDRENDMVYVAIAFQN